MQNNTSKIAKFAKECYTVFMQVSIILNCGNEIKRKIKGDKVVCCDGGFNVCPVKPDVILGDFDSLENPIARTFPL